MSSVEFSLNDDDLKTLQSSIQDFQGNSEDAINQCLENEVKPMLINSIINFIPVSEKNKNHAKYSDPLQGNLNGNLSLLIHTKKKYNYLYFPQEGEGTSKSHGPNDFMGKGIEQQYDNVVNIMLEKIQNKLEGM